MKLRTNESMEDEHGRISFIKTLSGFKIYGWRSYGTQTIINISYSDYVVALSCQIVAPWHWFCYAKLGVKCDLTADRCQSLGKGQVSTITDHQRGEIKFTYIKSIL